MSRCRPVSGWSQYHVGIDHCQDGDPLKPQDEWNPLSAQDRNPCQEGNASIFTYVAASCSVDQIIIMIIKLQTTLLTNESL